MSPGSVAGVKLSTGLTTRLYLAVAVLPVTESVAVTVKVSVPVAVGVPLIKRLLVPLDGTVIPGIAFLRLLTARVTELVSVVLITWS